jgi:hypothetical protein
MKANVMAVTTVDFSDQIDRRLTDAERKPLRRFMTNALSYISYKWKGWRYAGRPPGAPRNVSLAKWKGGIQSVEPRTVAAVIYNQAKSWDTGESYVAQVERRRGQGSEAAILINDIIYDMWPVTVEEMRVEIVKALNKPGKPQKMRRNTGIAPVTAAPIIL